MYLYNAIEEVVIDLISPDPYLLHYYVRKLEGHCEMIWTHLICNFITNSPNTKPLLAQHIPLRRNIHHHFLETFQMASLSHSSEMLQYHPQTVTCALSLPLLKPCT
jgi:hypothetical protein